MKSLAKLVLELDALREEKRELMKACQERIEAKQDELIEVARDEMSEQLTIEGAPISTVVGMTARRSA